MLRMREIVQQAINTGYLDIQAEEQLRQLLSTKYDGDDLRLFMKLQLAAMNGEVRLESHEQRRLLSTQSLAYSRRSWTHPQELSNSHRTATLAREA